MHNRNTQHAGVESTVHKVGQGYVRGRGNPAQGSQGFDKKECYRCGSDKHLADACYFKNQQCFQCKKVGHAKVKCRQNKANNQRKQGRVYYEGTEELSQEMDLVEEGLNFVTLYSVQEVEGKGSEDGKWCTYKDYRILVKFSEFFLYYMVQQSTSCSSLSGQNH